MIEEYDTYFVLILKTLLSLKIVVTESNFDIDTDNNTILWLHFLYNLLVL